MITTIKEAHKTLMFYADQLEGVAQDIISFQMKLYTIHIKLSAHQPLTLKEKALLTQMVKMYRKGEDIFKEDKEKYLVLLDSPVLSREEE